MAEIDVVPTQFSPGPSISSRSRSNSAAVPAAPNVRSTLHIEIALKSGLQIAPQEIAKLQNEVLIALRVSESVLYEGQCIFPLDIRENLIARNVADLIQEIKVAHLDKPLTGDERQRYHDLSSVKLEAHAYCLSEVAPSSLSSSRHGSTDDSDDEEVANSTVALTLPHTTLQGLWDSLVFEEPIPQQLLRATLRGMELSKVKGLDMNLFNYNHLFLLHGPPGTGKTTLCKALAQKISIHRWSPYIEGGHLVEISAAAMFSKWYGNSAKLLRRTFQHIFELASKPSMIVFVLIDEVEGIAGLRRHGSSSNGEPQDTLRLTNQLLTTLDKVRTFPNVMVFCTSNLISAVDPAFLDRVDVKQFVPVPGSEVAYELLRAPLNEFMRCALITAPSTSTSTISSRANIDALAVVDNDVQMQNGSSAATAAQRVADENDDQASFRFPSLDELVVYGSGMGERLMDIAARCVGMSGRNLRRLPFMSLAMHTYGGAVSVDEALDAIQRCVGELKNQPQCGSIESETSN